MSAAALLRQQDVARIVRGAALGGSPVAQIRIAPDGTITFLCAGHAPALADSANPWDDELLKTQEEREKPMSSRGEILLIGGPFDGDRQLDPCTNRIEVAARPVSTFFETPVATPVLGPWITGEYQRSVSNPLRFIWVEPKGD